ncbi:hypothetical protein FACS1894152_2110 [Bacilli bacterium]|nr:hypothetical protein FACS1894152_2110 [Bacilli bacterium]
MKKYLLLLPILMCSCSTQRIIFDEKAYLNSNKEAEPTESKPAHFFVGGIGQKDTVNPETICGKGNVAYVEAQQSFIDGLLTSVTSGVYSPRTFNIYCKTPVSGTNK